MMGVEVYRLIVSTVMPAFMKTFSLFPYNMPTTLSHTA